MREQVHHVREARKAVAKSGGWGGKQGQPPQEDEQKGSGTSYTLHALCITPVRIGQETSSD